LRQKAATQYQPGDLVLLLRKFIQSRRINAKLDYRYLGPFKVIKMVGENAVRLDIARKYPKLHPVFNVSLVAKYHPPSQFASRGKLQGIKDTYYDSGRIIDWSKLHQILDARLVKSKAHKGKYEFLLRWFNSTPGEDTWVLKDHIPSPYQKFLQQFIIQWTVWQQNKKRNGNR
jgi:hypothetical protein